MYFVYCKSECIPKNNNYKRGSYFPAHILNTSIFNRFPKAEEEVASLTKQLQQLEDDLDAAESKLAETSVALTEAEKQADESERYLHACNAFK